MKQYRYILPILAIFAILILSACTKNANTSETDEADPVEQTPVQGEQAGDELNGEQITAAFSNLPNELILAPNSILDLQIEGAKYSTTNPALLSINEEGKLQVATDAPTGQHALVTISLGEQIKEIEIKIKYALADTIVDVNGVATITNPDDLVVLVNKERSLPADYVPAGLIPPNIPFYFSENIEKRWLRPEAAQAIEELVASAREDGIELVGASAYRSYATQESLFAQYVRSHGEEQASRFSARPGQSEHQTGLTIDVYHKQITNGLEEAFADTPEGMWVAEHAHEYGFIVRYPKGKEDITGYTFEPWHLRYVGINVAQEIYERGITLEEYFQTETLYTTK